MGLRGTREGDFPEAEQECGILLRRAGGPAGDPPAEERHRKPAEAQALQTERGFLQPKAAAGRRGPPDGKPGGRGSLCALHQNRQLSPAA